MTTINDLCVASSFSPDDKLPMWSNANGVTRALPLSVLTAQFLTADSINQLAASATTETFVSGSGFTPGVTTSITLANQYLSKNNIEVFFDASFQGPDQFTLVGNTLAFISPIPVGVQSVYVRGGATRLTGAPSDGTVTDAKVASGSKLYNRINDLIDVRDYGAIGNGIADDTVAIQAAVNAVMALPAGGRLYAPAGTYLINFAISIPKNTSKTLRFFGDGAATIFKAGPSLVAGAVFNLGAGSSAAGGMDCVISSMNIQPQVGTNHTGFVCLNMNGIIFDDVHFGAIQNGVTLNACFATRFIGCQWILTSTYGIYSFTPAHNIILDRCSAFAIGVNVLYLVGATNNVVIQNCDFESCGNVYRVAAGSSSIRVTGSYIEYTTNQEFFHEGPCYNVIVEGNWIALNGGGSGAGLGGGTATYQNWIGGSFKHNSGFNMSIAWDTTVADVDVGENFSVGSFTVGVAPFTAVSSFTNTWTAGTHTVGYKKFENGLVEIRGNCTAGASSLGNVAFQLPAAYRPVQQKVFACITTTNALAVVIVDTNGNVVPNVPGGGVGAVVNLDGVMFNAVPQ
jgi:hypothetical protein